MVYCAYICPMLEGFVLCFIPNIIVRDAWPVPSSNCTTTFA